MNFQLDRSLPVSIAAQLRGQIEYSIACGDLPPGCQLPTVRDLAERLRISPVTVSSVYKALQEKKLLLPRPGQGTFVTTELGPLSDSEDRHHGVTRMIDQLLRLARSKEIGTNELLHMIQLRQAAGEGAGVRLLFVGLFADATASYAAQVQRELGSRDVVDAATLAELASPAWRAAARYDLALASRHTLTEVERLLGDAVPVSAVGFIPAEETRARLAQLEPMARVGVVSTYPEFLGTLKRSVTRFASHVDVVLSTVRDEFDPHEAAGACDAVVYATGSESILSELPSFVPAFEYRHVPDPRDVRRALRPKIETLRQRKIAPAPADAAARE